MSNPFQQAQSPWAALATAEITERGIWFQGDFDGEVHPRRVFVKSTFQSGTCWFVETEVLLTNHPSHAVGQRVTWIQKLQNVQVAMGAIKQFITAALGFDPRNREHVTHLAPKYEGIVNAALADPDNQAGQNHLISRPVHLITRIVPKKNSPGQFTIHDWGLSTGQAGPMVEIIQPPATAVVTPPAFGPQPEAPTAFNPPQAPTAFNPPQALPNPFDPNQQR